MKKLGVILVFSMSCGGVEPDERETFDPLTGTTLYRSHTGPEFQAILSISVDGRSCGGALVRSDIVLTTRSCLPGEEAPPLDGAWHPLEAEVLLGDVIAAPLLRLDAHFAAFAPDADIGLLGLETPVPSSIAVPRAVSFGPLREAALATVYGFDAGRRSYAYAQDFTEVPSRSNEWTALFRSAGTTPSASDFGSPVIVLGLREEAASIATESSSPIAGVVAGGRTGEVTIVRTNGPDVAGFLRPRLRLSFCGQLEAVRAFTEMRVKLFSWYSPSRGDNVTSSSPGWAGCAGDVLFPDYVFVRVEGLVHSPNYPAPAGTVALHRWYSPGRDDGFTTSSPSWIPASLSAGDSRSPDYVFVRREGYVVDPALPRPAGMVTLHGWWSGLRGDNSLTSSPGWQGSAGEERSPDYDWVRREGHLFAP